MRFRSITLLCLVLALVALFMSIWNQVVTDNLGYNTIAGILLHLSIIIFMFYLYIEQKK